MPLLDQFALYAVRDASGGAPDIAIHHAKRAVLDWLAAALPGTRCPPATLLRRAAAGEFGVGRSSVLGHGGTAFAATAAWLNGTAAHALELDDIYREAVYHPGSPIVAAALAVAEARGAGGRALLNAIVVGYEISTRIGAALQPSHLMHFHATGTMGVLGAAAASAVLLAPGDPRVVRDALATAASFASGLQQALRGGAMTKPLHAGHAAATGVRAAEAAAAGVTGAADILEGEVGLGAAMCSAPAWERATQGLGHDYHITRITHKPHACCGHVFPAIDAALVLRAGGDGSAGHGVDARDIAAIEVVTYATAIEATGRFDLATPYEAKFSLPYVVSHALVHGAVRLDAFEPERVADPQLRALMGRCTLSADLTMSARFPSERQARVSVTLNDGRRLSHAVPHRRGDPEWPLTDAELESKFDGLCVPVLGRERARRLREQVWQLDRIDLTALALDEPALAEVPR